MAGFYPNGIVPKARDFGRRIRKKGDEFVQKVLASRQTMDNAEGGMLGQVGGWPCIGPCIDENGKPVWVNFTSGRIRPEQMESPMAMYNQQVLKIPSYDKRSWIKYGDIIMDPVMYGDSKNKIAASIASPYLTGAEPRTYGTQTQKIGKDGRITRQWVFDDGVFPQYVKPISTVGDGGNGYDFWMSPTEMKWRNAVALSKTGRKKPYMDYHGEWNTGSKLKGMIPDDVKHIVEEANDYKLFYNKDRLEFPIQEEIDDGSPESSRFMTWARKEADRKRVHDFTARFLKEHPSLDVSSKVLRDELEKNGVRKYDAKPYLNMYSDFAEMGRMDTTPFDSKFTNPEYLQRMHDKIMKNKGK